MPRPAARANGRVEKPRGEWAGKKRVWRRNFGEEEWPFLDASTGAMACAADDVGENAAPKASKSTSRAGNAAALALLQLQIPAVRPGVGDPRDGNHAARRQHHAVV